MPLISLPEGWKRFGDNGRRWRCVGPRFFCEVDDAGNTPNYANRAATVARIQRIRLVYLGRVQFGMLDQNGNALHFLVANSLTESFGTVPSPLATNELRNVYNNAVGIDTGSKLDEVVRYVAMHAPNLRRLEPDYLDPVRTPGQVSVGAHHVLISTALDLRHMSRATREQRIAESVDLVCRLPAESLYAAELAVEYFNQSFARHSNEPPLLAATYNAGAPSPDPTNIWNLQHHGNHLDRWIAFYNTSLMI